MDIQTNFDKVAARFEAPDDFKKMMMGNPNKKITELAAELIKLHEEGGKYDEEIRCMDSMIQQDSRLADHFFPWLQKGMLFGIKENYEESVKCYDKAIELGCNVFELWYGKAMSLAKLGKYEEALTCSEKAIGLDHTHLEDDSVLEDLWYLKGQIHLHMGQIRKAITCYTKVTELNPNNDWAWDNMGGMFNELGEHEKALECFEKSIKADPTGEGWYNKGRTLRRLDRNEESIECFTKATKIHPTEPDGWIELGYCFYDSGKPEEAVECFDKVIELDPDRPNIEKIWWVKSRILHDKISELGPSDEKVKEITAQHFKCLMKYFRAEPNRELARSILYPIFGDDLDKNLSDDEIVSNTLKRIIFEDD